jgi:hypothetical protein
MSKGICKSSAHRQLLLPPPPPQTRWGPGMQKATHTVPNQWLQSTTLSPLFTSVY